MDRLTTWNGKKWVLPQGYGTFRKIAERLAAYENIGLEPEEISQTLEAYKRTGLDPEDVEMLKLSYEWEIRKHKAQKLEEEKPMKAYRFTVKAYRERFMEPTLHETHDYYVMADSYEQAHSHVWSMLNKAGWKVEKFLTGEEIIVQDIRSHGEAK